MQVISALLWLFHRLWQTRCDKVYEQKLHVWNMCHAPDVFELSPETCERVFSESEPNVFFICFNELIND